MHHAPARPLRPACPHRRLRRLLTRELPPSLFVGDSTLRPWASANFVGARHLFPCFVDEGEAEHIRGPLQTRLDALEWRLAGHIVADIAVEAVGEGLRIEILTVEE